MRIQILSDIHLEFEDYKLDYSGSDIVVLAGDVHIGDKGIKWVFDQIIDIPVVYVLGNHEYYRNTYPRLIRKIKLQTQGSNITLLENESLRIEDVVFHGCTLWTDFNIFGNPRVDGYECQQKMTDYKKIRREPNYSKIRALDVAVINNHSARWLSNDYENNKGQKNIIVTHHSPSANSLPEMHRKDRINAAYASNLESLIEKLSPELWIHGHIHESSDYRIGQTRVVCNPKGYLCENRDFRHKFIISI